MDSLIPPLEGCSGRQTQKCLGEGRASRDRSRSPCLPGGALPKSWGTCCLGRSEPLKASDTPGLLSESSERRYFLLFCSDKLKAPAEGPLRPTLYLSGVLYTYGASQVAVKSLLFFFFFCLSANARDARDADSIPESGKSPGVGNGNPLQYS